MKNLKKCYLCECPIYWVSKPVQRPTNEPLPVTPSATSSQCETLITSSGSLQEADDERHLVTQAELNDLIQDLYLTKQASRMLESKFLQLKQN